MRILKRGLILIIVVSVLLLVSVSVSCRNDSVQPGSAAENGQENTGLPDEDEIVIEMIDIKFNPDTVTIKQGTTVTWVNKDSVIHTTTSGTRNNESGLFDSGNIRSGESFSYTFNEKGTFEYFCVPHFGMDGTVEVE